MAAIHPNQASNCWLSADGFGTRRVRVIRVEHGLNIMGDTDSTKGYEAYYPLRVSKGSVIVTFVFPSHETWDNFSKWMERYGRRLSSTNDQVGPMRVLIPGFGFNISAVPVSGWSFGDQVGRIVYRSTVTFDAAGANSDFENLEISRFRKPTRDWQNSRFFYPTGRQVGTALHDRLSGTGPDLNDTVRPVWNPDDWDESLTGTGE